MKTLTCIIALVFAVGTAEAFGYFYRPRPQCRKFCPNGFVPGKFCVCLDIVPPQCRKSCPHGYTLDKKQCVCVPDQPQCRKFCPNGFVPGKFCVCRDQGTRPQCLKFCPYGFLPGKVCVCRPEITPPVCKKNCPHGYTLDKQQCVCVPARPQCLKFCPNGFLPGKVCVCRPEVIPPQCRKSCPHGYILDKKQCVCVPVPTQCRKSCPHGYTLDKKQCVCVPAPPQCRKACPPGYTLDKFCRCQPKPGTGCAAVTCPVGTRCVEKFGQTLCVSIPTVTPPRTCQLQKDPGPCRASIPRYFWNIYTRRCEKFTYGGCRGNQNNFKTLRQCTSTCGRQHRGYKL